MRPMVPVVRALVAAVAALIFGVQPGRIESVAWISGVTDPLLALLMISSFLAFLDYREERGGKWLAVSLALYAVALYGPLWANRAGLAVGLTVEELTAAAYVDGSLRPTGHRNVHDTDDHPMRRLGLAQPAQAAGRARGARARGRSFPPGRFPAPGGPGTAAPSAAGGPPQGPVSRFGVEREGGRVGRRG